jgi:beta-lactamase regulating signal transducer with metallopeptidase domain
MIAPDFQSVAQNVASRGLNTFIEAFAIAVLSWSILRLSNNRSSTTRFAVWFSTLLVIAGLPLLSRASSPRLASGSHIPEVLLSSNWALPLFAAWALIAGVLLIRLGVSLCHLHALRRSCREIDISSRSALMEVAQGFNKQSRRVKLLASDDVHIPTALGFFRPAVVLPTWTLRDLSTDELKVILLHELAHLQRWDDWTNLAQKILKALFFFHPAVWWIDNRLALEREIACDDMVLEQSANARTYAASLISVAEKVVAEKMRTGRALALAQSALGRVREVSQRVAQILDKQRTRTSHGWRPALAMIGTLALITVAGMPYAPELISFESKTQPVLSAASESTASLPMKATPVVFKQPISRTQKSVARNAAANTRPHSRADVVPAKAIMHKQDRTPKVTMARWSDRRAPTDTFLVWHSSQFDESDSTVWTLTVWRVRSANGEQQMLQETIVMNSL